jgi:hypothetical protein
MEEIMKKILSIALIAALTVCSVFAATFTGSAALELGYDLDTKDYGFANNASTKLNFGFELGSGEGGQAGEKDLRAEIAGTFKVEFKAADYKASGAAVNATVSELKLTKANILYKDVLTVGILDAGSSADYASSYNVRSADGKVTKKGKTTSNLIQSLSGVPGFTVTANKLGVTGGFGLTGKADDTKVYNVLAYATLADKELAEGFKLSVGAGALLKGDAKTSNSTIQANLKAAYAKDELSASAALDFQTVLVKDQDAKVGFESSIAAAYDFVSLKAYLYSMDKFENFIADAKIAAEKTFDIEEGVSVTANGSFEANNIADKTRDANDETEQNGGKQEFTIAAGASATVDVFTFGLKASYGIKAKVLSITPSVKYAHEMFTASLSGTFETVIETEKSNVLSIEASITSDKVIDGATLALTYDKASYTGAYMNLLKDQTKEQSLGKITASATVKF